MGQLAQPGVQGCEVIATQPEFTEEREVEGSRGALETVLGMARKGGEANKGTHTGMGKVRKGL